MPPSSPPFPIPELDPRMPKAPTQEEQTPRSMPKPPGVRSINMPRPPTVDQTSTQMPQPHIPQNTRATSKYQSIDSTNRPQNTVSFPEPITEASTLGLQNNGVSSEHSNRPPGKIFFPQPELPDHLTTTEAIRMPTVEVPNFSIPLAQPAGEMPRFPVPEIYLGSGENEEGCEEGSAEETSFSDNDSNMVGVVPVTDDLYPPLFSGYPPAKPSQVAALSDLTGRKDLGQFEWVYSVDGYIPPEAVGCGKEVNGAPLYVARRDYKKVTHVGLVGPHLKGIRFTRKNSVLKQKACYVLCGNIQGLRWIKHMGSFKAAGEELVQAGVTENGKPIHIGIVDYRGGIYIGEVGEHIQGGMSFAYQSKKIIAPDFYYVLAYN
ncbi:hypothetical protein K493DRAFT_84463 [Basidiobolus meristosporus CBS 931.73]|uniref:Uncharacterized protein n=1 Tax=Basidiobolus meristosporus CBS 931.73 TaxID=1314790 RepID=A0A1Y1XJ09_9FUNG|nr:hypothetical protein K493DRAFT_84463 [Basidiobolus meristosporus CBS 931.73]|eukprot:ORX85748.1 hypothetical protein K493DRAFT_84463 [Basidiobolus meristosporus CBS 931.73]